MVFKGSIGPSCACNETFLRKWCLNWDLKDDRCQVGWKLRKSKRAQWAAGIAAMWREGQPCWGGTEKVWGGWGLGGSPKKELQRETEAQKGWVVWTISQHRKSRPGIPSLWLGKSVLPGEYFFTFRYFVQLSTWGRPPYYPSLKHLTILCIANQASRTHV